MGNTNHFAHANHNENLPNIKFEYGRLHDLCQHVRYYNYNFAERFR